MNLFYRELGIEHKNSGNPSLLILHGLFGSCDNWLTISKKIAQKYHVLLIDQRNHGRSPHHEQHDYESLSEDLYEFIQQQNLQKPALIGHSMGGKTVLFLAKNYPEVFDRLLIADMGIKSYPVRHQKILAGFNAVNLSTLKSRRQADEILAQHEPNLGIRQFLLKNLYRNNENKFAWRINLPVLTEQIANLGKPLPTGEPIVGKILFLRGENSNYVPLEDFQMIKNQFPTAQIATLRGAGHWLHAEKPTEFLEMIWNFMEF